MNSEPAPSERAIQLRQALVATANLGPYVRRRPPLKLVIGSLAAFALAGALTGGAVAHVSTVDPDVSAAQAAAEGAAKYEVGMEDGTTLGKPVTRTGAGTQVIDVGTAPAGATGLVEGFVCVDAGKFVGFLDSKQYESYTDCEPSSAGAGFVDVVRAGRHTLTMKAPDGARFAIWVSWAKVPTLVESGAQKQELSDGLITRDEVVAAFSRYEGCMGALGHPIDMPPTSIVPSYSVDDSAVADGSDNRCYVTEYRGVDEKWQLELQASKVGVASVAACVASNKVGSGHSNRAIATPTGVLPDLTACPWIG
jgi:hypothetical protein